MALDLEGRMLYRCSNPDCPFDGKLVDLTRGGFVEVADKLYHEACYAATAVETAAQKSRREKREKAAADDAKLREEVTAQHRAVEIAEEAAAYPAGETTRGVAIPESAWRVGDPKPPNASAVPVPSATPPRR